MGAFYSYSYSSGIKPDYIPDYNGSPTFDPQLGFKVPRKQRESKLSYEEMRALQFPPAARDYCAHALKDYYVCWRKNVIMYGFCNKEYLAYEHCQLEDYVLRMKEYEREKRLRIRELKKKKKEKLLSQHDL